MKEQHIQQPMVFDEAILQQQPAPVPDDEDDFEDDDEDRPQPDPTREERLL